MLHELAPRIKCAHFHSQNLLRLRGYGTVTAPEGTDLAPCDGDEATMSSLLKELFAKIDSDHSGSLEVCRRAIC